MTDVTNKLWNFCHTLRHDGVDYGDYIEQLTYLLFLKMSDEKELKLPADCSWSFLRQLSGEVLLKQYEQTLKVLSFQKGILGRIYAQATNRINNPTNLKKLLELIDEIAWTELDVDVKGEAFEGLLERSASEGKKGAGQYFTPRPLIRSIVRVMQPNPLVSKNFTICDPSCGTGGFLLQAYEWVVSKLDGEGVDKKALERIHQKTYYGYELVARPARLAMMNLFLHGISTEIFVRDTIYEAYDGKLYDCILTNPPFGTKGGSELPNRPDFSIKTSSKQLNFIQHYLTSLKPGGRAAVIVPDNVLFDSQAAILFESLTKTCNLHTILKLPRGTFTPYAQGVKANVIFFQKGLPTENVWIYDARASVKGFTKKDRPLNDEFFADFEKAYGDDPNGNSKRVDTGLDGRFRSFHIQDIAAKNYKLDISWLKDDVSEVEDLPSEPIEIIELTIQKMESALGHLRNMAQMLEKNGMGRASLGR